MTAEEAEAAEREAFAAIGELGLLELDAVKTWVASGCEGPKPEPGRDERLRLNERLAKCVGAVEHFETTDTLRSFLKGELSP
jgi:hypothetical protein